MASKYLQKYPVPEGFSQILHDFSREVLRDQPEDIIKYGAEYFEAIHLGKEFKFESKFNIAKGQSPEKKHKPPRPADLTVQAKQIVEVSNNRPPSSKPRIASAKPGSRQNPNDVSHQGSQASHPEEKQAARQYVDELYNKMTMEANDENILDNQGQENDYDYQNQEQVNIVQEVNQEGINQANLEVPPEIQAELQQSDVMLNAADFDARQMEKLIKIQATAKGSIARKQVKGLKNTPSQPEIKAAEPQQEEQTEQVQEVQEVKEVQEVQEQQEVQEEQ